jgi:hypothetical protein
LKGKNQVNLAAIAPKIAATFRFPIRFMGTPSPELMKTRKRLRSRPSLIDATLAPLRTLCFLTSLALCAMRLPATAQEDADKMADQFAHPPESAKPWTWWHWISGNISKVGITADLEAMKQIGLGGAQIFTVEQSARWRHCPRRWS